MKKYRCKKTLLTSKIVNGEIDFSAGITVNVGEIFEMDEADDARAMSKPDKTWRLVAINSDSGYWIELAKRKLSKYFTEITK